MKLRILAFTLLILGGFFYFTSRTHWGQQRIFHPIANAGTRLWSGPLTVRTAGLGADELNNIDIYKMARLATVNVTSTVYRRGGFFLSELYQSRDFGSGFLIDASGRILTNNHVIGDRNRVEVTMSDQTHYRATVIAQNPQDDLALLQISPKKKYAFLHLGDSEHIQVGQKVLAIGNPFGLEGTLTTGIVSSLGRKIQGENEQLLEGMIQTDAAINPGNSGGPLLDSAGNVIGINTAIYGPGGNIGIGFASPINKAKTMLDEFQAGRTFRRPLLGVMVVYVAGDYADALDLPPQGGLLVTQVTSGGAAEKAGLRAGKQQVIIGNQQINVGGDFIVAIDGKAVDREDALSRALGRKRAGDSIDLTIYRDGRPFDKKIVLGEAPE